MKHAFKKALFNFPALLRWFCAPVAYLVLPSQAALILGIAGVTSRFRNSDLGLTKHVLGKLADVAGNQARPRRVR
jgi:hypothetical protein